MISTVITQLEMVIREYGALGVFFAALAEEVVAPVPSSLVAMFSGFFLVPTGHSLLSALAVSMITIAIPMSIGVTIGSLVFYGFAYFGGKPVIVRYGKWFGLSWEYIEETEKKFIEGKADEIILFTLRSIPFVPSVAISAFCGLVRYPIKTFVLMTFLGTFVRSTIMAMVGWKVRDAYTIYAGLSDTFESYAVILIVLVAVVFWSLRARKKYRNTE